MAAGCADGRRQSQRSVPGAQFDRAAAAQYLPTTATLVVMKSGPAGLHAQRPTRLSGQLAGVYYWVETLTLATPCAAHRTPNASSSGVPTQLPRCRKSTRERFGSLRLPGAADALRERRAHQNGRPGSLPDWPDAPLPTRCPTCARRSAPTGPRRRQPCGWMHASALPVHPRPQAWALRAAISARPGDAAQSRQRTGRSRASDGSIDNNAYRRTGSSAELDRRVLSADTTPRLAVWGLDV